MGGKGCRPRRLPEPLIEDVHHRSTGKPVVEIAQHDEQCVSDGIEILENLPHLKPPLAHPQAGYRFTSHAVGKAPVDPEDWLEAAPRTAGSWWPRWSEWLARHSRKQVNAAPVTGLPADQSPCDAPGSYVHRM